MLLLYLPGTYLLGLSIWILLGAIALAALLRIRRDQSSTGRRRRMANAGLSVWMLAAVITLAEVAFALTYDTTDAFNITNVSQRWHDIHVKPQQRRVPVGAGEQIVYRDSVAFPRTVNDKRHHVLFLGDSFTVGHGIANVEDRFSNRVRHKLKETAPGRFIVSNLSDEGCDLFWVNAALARLINSDYKIDTAVYVICLNDIETFSQEFQDFYGSVSEAAPTFFLFRDTYLLNFLYFRAIQFHASEISDYYSSLKELFKSEPWRKMSEMLQILSSECEQNGIDLRVVIFPFLHTSGDEYEFQDVHDTISGFCKNSGIAVLDLADHLHAHRQSGLTVNAFDPHPNERAHELAADAILQHLLYDLIPDTK